MIAVTQIPAFLAWFAANPELAVLNELRTASIGTGPKVAARLAPGVTVPDGCPATGYNTVGEAMAAHPDLPWHMLPVWSGEQVEPELLAAREAWAATNQESAP